MEGWLPLTPLLCSSASQVQVLDQSAPFILTCFKEIPKSADEEVDKGRYLY